MINVIELLKADHALVNQLFEQAEATSDTRELQQIFSHIYKELTLHTAAEENVFYPAVRNHADTSGLVAESYEDHAEAKQIMLDISVLKPEPVAYKAKLEQLKAAITHHVTEEEGELFPKVERHMDTAALVTLAKEVEQAKSEARQKLLGMYA